MDAGDFRAGNAAAALEFLARFDADLRCAAAPRPQRGWPHRRGDRRARSPSAPPAKKAREFRPRRRHPRRTRSSKGIILEDTKEGVRWKRNSMNIHTKAVHAGDRKKPAPNRSRSPRPSTSPSSFDLRPIRTELDRIFGARRDGLRLRPLRQPHQPGAGRADHRARKRPRLAGLRLRHGGARSIALTAALIDRPKTIVAATPSTAPPSSSCYDVMEPLRRRNDASSTSTISPPSSRPSSPKQARLPC